MNKVAESKNVTVNINVKAITGGYNKDTTNSTEGENVAKTVKITITSGGKTLWSDSQIDKNESNKAAQITGKGAMDLTLTITDENGMNKVRTKTVNFDSDTSVNFS